MADGPYIEFGRKITFQREQRRWSISEAARQMTVPRPALSRWEHGHELPSGENMIKLVDHLHVSIGTNEVTQGIHRTVEAGFQLALPFDQPTNFEVEVTRKSQDVVRLEFRVKGLAS